jgi:hypothetical protein
MDVALRSPFGEKCNGKATPSFLGLLWKVESSIPPSLIEKQEKAASGHSLFPLEFCILIIMDQATLERILIRSRYLYTRGATVRLGLRNAAAIKLNEDAFIRGPGI